MADDPGTRAMQAKQRRQWITLGVLAAVLGVIALVQLVRSEPAPASASSPTAAEQAATDPPPGKKTLAGVEVIWPMRIDRDVFAWEQVFAVEPEMPEPVEVDEPEPVEIGPDIEELRREAKRVVRLQAIIQGDDPIAMINGAVHRVGDTAGGFTIRRIALRAIILEQQGVEIRLEL